MDVEVAVPLLAVIMLVPTPNSVVDPRVVVRVVDPLIIVETMADVVIADVEGRVRVEEKDWYVPVGREAEDVPADVPTKVSTSWDAAIAKREPNVRILENNMAAVVQLQQARSILQDGVPYPNKNPRTNDIKVVMRA